MHSLPGKPDMLMSIVTVPPPAGTVAFCGVSVMLGVGKAGFVVGVVVVGADVVGADVVGADVVVEGGLVVVVVGGTVVVVVGGGLLRTM